MDITQGQPSGSPPNPRQRRVDSANGFLPADPLKPGSVSADATLSRAIAARGDSVELSSPAAMERARGLVAAKVSELKTSENAGAESPRRASAAVPASGPHAALPMYRNPAIKNAVATELAIGKIIDAQA